jgi:hypothetical protein
MELIKKNTDFAFEKLPRIFEESIIEPIRARTFVTVKDNEGKGTPSNFGRQKLDEEK